MEEAAAVCAGVDLRSGAVQLVVQVRLLPTPGQASAPEATLRACGVDGRMKNLRFACSPGRLRTLVEHRRGESDPVRRGGKWFPVAACGASRNPRCSSRSTSSGWTGAS